MSSALQLCAVAIERLAGICRCSPSDITSGRVGVVSFEERENRFRAEINHPVKGNVVHLGLLRPPPGGYPPTIVSRVPREPPPLSMSSQDALHKLAPRVVERIEVSLKAKPGAIGAGELSVISFGPVEGRSGIFKAMVYVPSTDSTHGLIGTFEPIPRIALIADLPADDLTALVPIFARLRKWQLADIVRRAGRGEAV